MSTVIDHVLCALNARDLERYVACYDPAPTIEEAAGQILASGHSEIRKRYELMFESLPGLRIEASARWEVGEFVVQDELVRGRGSHEERHIAIYRISNDLILREQLLS